MIDFIIKKILSLILIFWTISTTAQNYKELDGDSYRLEIDKKYPFKKMKILKKTSDGNFIPTSLEEGKYKLFMKDEFDGWFKFKIAKNQIIEKGTIEGSYIDIFIENSLIVKSKGKHNGKIFQIISNPKDSTITGILHKDGKLKKKDIIFFTKKDYKKQITTKYNDNGSYEVIYKINSQNKLDDRIIKRECYTAKGKLTKCK